MIFFIFSYRQYIKDREHFHMNSTWWHTLSEFVQYMGKHGKAEVEKAERGDWWITYIGKFLKKKTYSRPPPPTHGQYRMS